ncbi:XkdX family protein [Clostridium novyi]|nr:XkdX family protein [Clostridium novyi]
MYKFIKEYFDLKLYTIEDVKVFVVARWITEEEFKTITGTEYIA